jgi:hypothetical protein
MAAAGYGPVQWRGPDVIPEGDYGSLEEALAAGRRGYAEGTLPSYQEAVRESGKLRGKGGYTRDMPMHANAMRMLARNLQPYLGAMTSPVLEGAGLVNEWIDAGRGVLGGGSQAGFDPTDLVANKLGIDYGRIEAGSGP